MATPVARWSTPFEITNFGGGNRPMLAPIGGAHPGEFVVVWDEFGDPASLGDASGRAVYGRLYNEDGSENGGYFLVNTTTASEQVNPVVINRGSEEGFAVAFTDLSGANGTSTDVRLQLFDGAGVPDGTETVVGAGGTTIGNIQNQPAIARGRDFGLVFVAYEDSASIAAGEIRGQLFGDTGPVGADFLITTADPPLGESDTHTQPNVTAIPNLGFLVTWVDNTESGLMFTGGTAIRGQLYSYTGVAAGGQFTIASGTADSLLSFPQAAGITATDNTFMVTWVQDDDAGSGTDYNVHGRIFTTNGLTTTGGTDFVLSESADGNQTEVVVAPYDDDRFIAVWTHQLPFQAPEVHARMFNADGTPSTDEFVVIPEDTLSSTFDGHLASVTVLDDTINAHPFPRFVVTWNDNHNNMYGQIFSPTASELLGIDWFGADRDETYTAQYDERVMAGNGGMDTLTGSAFDDRIDGGADNDNLNGAGGNDILIGGLGDDTLDGGGDTDTADYSFFGGPVTVSLAVAGPQDTGVTGFDTLVGIENIISGAAGDLLVGDANANVILALDGSDQISGLAGADILDGGLGKDVLGGGTDADIFDFNSKTDSRKGGQRDVIIDFERFTTGEKIDLSGIDAKAGGGNQAFKWIGKADFHGRKGELHFVKKGGYVLVEGDTNGDGRADFQIQVNGVGALAKDDFFL